MIIGNGLVAKSFKREKKFFKNIIVFASGLANSKNINKKEFVREKKLLKKFLNIKKKKLIYFSTLDIFRKKKKCLYETQNKYRKYFKEKKKYSNY